MGSQRRTPEGSMKSDCVELDEVFDAVLFNEDFHSFLGRSTFNSILAAVVQKEYHGQPSFGLIDVLNLVEPLYARDIRELFGSQQNHFGFYGYISSMKRRSNDDEWKAFCRKLYFRVTTACKRLQKRPVTENHPTTMPVPQQYDAAGSPRSRARSGTGYSSRFPAPPSPPPPHQGYARSSTLDDTPSQPQQTSEPRGNHNVSQIDDNVQNRTSLLKEHVDSVGGILDFKENMASSDPVTWRCVATLDDLFSEGTGRSKKEAKHAASKEMCIMLGLSMD